MALLLENAALIHQLCILEEQVTGTSHVEQSLRERDVPWVLRAITLSHQDRNLPIDFLGQLSIST